MKKSTLTMASFLVLAGFTACNNTETTTTTTTTDSNKIATDQTVTDNTTNVPVAKTPFTGEDSIFVWNAALGGMMEVEAGNLAQQNATSDRVKAFATMMVNDHSKANAELMSMASARGMTLPTALPADMQTHMEAMKKMTGKAFDKHYMDMMTGDHKKAIADFEKQSSSGADAELKAWATKTLPALQMHRDSAEAISKAKM